MRLCCVLLLAVLYQNVCLSPDASQNDGMILARVDAGAISSKLKSGPWHAAPPLSNDAAVSIRSAGHNVEFRGSFRDLSLWVDRGASAESTGFLWVIEGDDRDLLRKEQMEVEKLGLKVIMHERNSMVVQGSSPDELDEDKCEGRKDMSITAVEQYEVTPRQMPKKDMKKYAKLAKKKQASIEALLEPVQSARLESFDRYLQDFHTRKSHMKTFGILAAEAWGESIFADYGFKVTRERWESAGGRWSTPGDGESIVATLPGTANPERFVVVGAHLDSTTGSGRRADLPRSAGADDNASGSSAMLEMARVIGESGIRFKHSFVLILFSGEEQGLLGATAIAQKWQRENRDIIAMLNLDMIGWRDKNFPMMLNLGSANTNEQASEIARVAIKTYFPDLEITRDRGPGTSDHRPFTSSGFPAININEFSGDRYDRLIHTTLDQAFYLDFEQMETHTKAALAVAALFAEIVEKKGPALPESSHLPPKSSHRRRREDFPSYEDALRRGPGGRRRRNVPYRNDCLDKEANAPCTHPSGTGVCVVQQIGKDRYYRYCKLTKPRTTTTTPGPPPLNKAVCQGKKEMDKCETKYQEGKCWKVVELSGCNHGVCPGDMWCYTGAFADNPRATTTTTTTLGGRRRTRRRRSTELFTTTTTTKGPSSRRRSPRRRSGVTRRRAGGRRRSGRRRRRSDEKRRRRKR